MAQHEEIVLWLDRRWKNAIEKHLKGETLQEHLETVLDELCNQLPQREYERISREIYAEDAANREAVFAGPADHAGGVSAPDTSAHGEYRKSYRRI